MKEHFTKYQEVFVETEMAIVYGDDRHAVAYLKSRSKPSWHYAFSNKEKSLSYSKKWAEEVTKSLLDREENKAKVRAELKAFDARNSDFLGKIFHSSSGYDQTTNHYFKLVQITSKSKGFAQKCKKIVTNHLSSMSERVTAGESYGELIPCTIRKDSVIIDGDHFWIWDGKPDYESYYG